MKTQRNILIAFLLNLFFAVFEFVGGLFTGSVAILSDAVHDLGDAAAIGVSFFMERKSHKHPDETYTYGYGRFSVLGGVITTCVLLVGSALVIYNAILRIINPTEIHYNGMILFAVVGVAVNFAAAFLTREGHSVNQRAVNLHMLEDVLGWIVVLIGAVVMRFTDFALIDPIMSIGVALFIIINALKNLSHALTPLLEKIPEDVSIDEIREHILSIDGISDLHHIHIWTIDGESAYATMHIVTDADPQAVKQAVRQELREHGIVHATLELETAGESCSEPKCNIVHSHSHHHHHHHHH